MPRPKKPTYEYVAKLGRYRKRIKDVDGAYVAVYGRTPEELTRKLEEAERSIAEGVARRDSPTVADYVETWISLQTPGMKHKYKESMIGALRLHVVPVIGALELAAVRPDDVQKVMAQLAGKSESLNGKVRQALRKVFRAAKQNGLIDADPCAEIQGRGKKTRRLRPLTPAQVETLLEAVAGTPAETFVRLALFAGLRREEALGLKWDSVNLDAAVPSLTVRRTVTFAGNMPVIDEDLKTTAAYRTIPIPEQLDNHLEKIKPLSEASGFVCTASKNPPTNSTWKNLWRYVRARQTGEATYKKRTASGTETVTFNRERGAKSRGADFRYSIDFPVTPHQLRHTYCTTLILSGANIKRVQYLMGHADIRVTLEIYSHLVENSPESLIGDVAQAFAVKSEVKTESTAPKAAK